MKETNFHFTGGSKFHPAALRVNTQAKWPWSWDPGVCLLRHHHLAPPSIHPRRKLPLKTEKQGSQSCLQEDLHKRYISSKNLFLFSLKMASFTAYFSYLPVSAKAKALCKLAEAPQLRSFKTKFYSPHFSVQMKWSGTVGRRWVKQG